MRNTLCIWLVALVFAITPSASESTGDGITIRAHSPTSAYREPDSFRLSVTLHNFGDSPLAILPRAIHREYTALGGGKARYSPFPGPPLAPWHNAFLLAPGETHIVELLGHRDGDGIWILEPGRYELRVRLDVTPAAADSAARHLPELGAPVWRGTLRSSPIRVSFRVEPTA